MLMEFYLEQYARVFARTDRDIWNYEDGCVLIGLNALWEATGDGRYFDAIRMFMDRYIGEDGAIRLYRQEDYNLDFIPSGRVLFPLYEKTGRQAYRQAAEALMEQLRRQPRTKAGSFWHKAIYPNQVWLDGLYMGLPFYAMYQQRFGSGDLSDIVLQFTNARKTLYDEKARLYRHAYCETRDIFWCDKETGLSPNFWTRSIGWFLMAFADVYELLTDEGQSGPWPACGKKQPTASAPKRAPKPIRSATAPLKPPNVCAPIPRTAPIRSFPLRKRRPTPFLPTSAPQPTPL